MVVLVWDHVLLRSSVVAFDINMWAGAVFLHKLTFEILRLAEKGNTEDKPHHHPQGSRRGHEPCKTGNAGVSHQPD